MCAQKITVFKPLHIGTGMAEPPAQLQTLRDLRYKCQTTELHDACRMGFLQAAQWLVTHAGSSVLTRCVCCGSTALHHACVGGHLDVVRWLVTDAGSCAKTERDAQASTALLVACAEGHLDVVRWLVTEVGSCAKTERNDWSQTALLRACRRGHLDVARWLVARDATLLHDVDKHGVDALSAACSSGCLPMCTWLIEEHDMVSVRRIRCVSLVPEFGSWLCYHQSCACAALCRSGIISTTSVDTAARSAFSARCVYVSSA